jgi:hypothetical protein
MRLSDIELDILLDTVAAHIVRASEGLDPVADVEALSGLLKRLSGEWDRRIGQPLKTSTDSIVESLNTMGTSASVDPFDKHPDAEKN